MQYEDYVTSRDAAGDLVGDEIFIFLQGGSAVQGSLDDLVAFVAESISGVEHYRGDWSTNNAFPSTGGNGVGGAPKAGDKWRFSVVVTVGSNGPYAAGTIAEAAVDSPASRSDWNIYAQQL